MDPEEIIARLEPWRDKYRRIGFRPAVEEGNGLATDSRFGGSPFIGEGAPWPACSVCQKPLQHLLQLDLATIPRHFKSAFGTGLLQLFYCTKDACQGMGGWTPFGNDLSRVRVVHPSGPAEEATERPGHFPPKRIVGWQRVTDYPSGAEHETLGLHYEFDHDGGTTRIECRELGLVTDDLTDEEMDQIAPQAASGDKLGGWPHWIQGPEYPSCPRCERTMELLFQVDSEDNVPFMFGDAGCGHVTQCPEHKDVVAFGWACS